MNTVVPSAAPFDHQGDEGEGARVDAPMRSFATDFGATATLHMESCVHGGQCAEACHFDITTRDPKYTPVHKLDAVPACLPA